MKTNLSLLIIGAVWPEPTSSAAGSRMLQLIGLFQEQGWKITFASAATESEWSFDLTSLGIEQVAIQLNDSGFDQWIQDLNPDIVLFDRFMVEEQFGWRVAEHCPNALRMLDTEDLHCLRIARQQAFQEQRDFKLEDLYSDTAKREIASILRCDLSLIISEFEMDLLRNEFKIDADWLHYLPFLTDELDDGATKKWLPFENRKDFIFIGNFLHEPNWNTVQYLKETIWPKIDKKLPEASMLIYGAYPSQKVLQLHQPKTRFLVMGRAKNAMQVVGKARIVLAPIRFGAGAKGKLLEAMQCGTPSVTTTVGAESMQGDLPWNGTIADLPETIAEAAIGLYQDEKLWKQSQKNGIAIVNQRYERSWFETDFIHRIFKLRENLKTHRQQNFFGSLLMHHTAASTKYLSRWIEAKNKK